MKKTLIKILKKINWIYKYQKQNMNKVKNNKFMNLQVQIMIYQINFPLLKKNIMIDKFKDK